MANISTFCFFDFAKCINSALPMNVKSKGLLSVYSTLGFLSSFFASLFAFGSSFILGFGFWDMVLGFFFFLSSMASRRFITLPTPYVLGKRYVNNFGSLFDDSCFSIVIGLLACGFSAHGFFACGFACGFLTHRFLVYCFLAFSLQSSMRLNIKLCLRLSNK